MPTTAAEELAKQVLRAIQGLEERMNNILSELPKDRQEYWRAQFQHEAESMTHALTPSV